MIAVPPEYEPGSPAWEAFQAGVAAGLQEAAARRLKIVRRGGHDVVVPCTTNPQETTE